MSSRERTFFCEDNAIFLFRNFVFDMFLNGEGVKEWPFFVRPVDLCDKYQRGTFDFLLISKKHGCVVFSVKTIGDFKPLNQPGGQAVITKALEKVFNKLVGQIQKQEYVLRAITKDCFGAGENITIKNVVIFPNLSLEEVLAAPQVPRDALITALEKENFVVGGERSLNHIITKEDLPQNYSLSKSEDGLGNIKEKLIGMYGDQVHTSCMALNQDCFNAIIARFSGPGTRYNLVPFWKHETGVEKKRLDRDTLLDIKTLKEAVFVVADHFFQNEFCLTEEQNNVIKTHSASKRLIVCGSMGVDVNTILLFRAFQAISSGYRVNIISFVGYTHACCQVFFNDFCKGAKMFGLPDTAQLLLCKKRNGREILDEVRNFLQSCSEEESGRSDAGSEPHRQKIHLIAPLYPTYFESIFKSMDVLIPEYHCTLSSRFFVPVDRIASFSVVNLQQSFCCPPVVIREGLKGYAARAFKRPDLPDVETRLIAGTPYLTDGPDIQRIRHMKSHETQELWNCEHCGREVARFINSLCKKTVRMEAEASASQGCIGFKDVLISGCIKLEEQPAVAAPNTGFLKGLDDEQIPYQIIAETDPEYPEKLGCPADDVVTISKPEICIGVKRAVVVVLGPDDTSDTRPQFFDPWFDVIDTCRSQLVVVHNMLNPIIQMEALSIE